MSVSEFKSWSFEVSAFVESWWVESVVTAGAGVVAMLVVRWLVVRRALAGRVVSRVLLPSTKFDPSVEEVIRAAAVLGRAHRVTRLPFTRRAFGIRIRLQANDEGLVVWSIEGHRRAQSVIELVQFDQTEARPELPVGDDASVEPVAEDGEVAA